MCWQIKITWYNKTINKQIHIDITKESEVRTTENLNWIHFKVQMNKEPMTKQRNVVEYMRESNESQKRKRRS